MSNSNNRRGGSRTQNARGGRKTPNSRSSQSDVKLTATPSTRKKDKDTKKSKVLKVDSQRPKREIPATNAQLREIEQKDREKGEEQEKGNPKSQIRPRGEIKKEKVNKIEKSEKSTKKVYRDEIEVESDESNDEMSEKDEINELKKKMEDMSVDIAELIDQNRILHNRIYEMDLELEDLKNDKSNEWFDKDDLTTEKLKELANDLAISKDNMEDMKKSFQKQFEDLKPVETEESWKIVDEKIMSGVKNILKKLEKRLKKKEMEEIVFNLKNEMKEIIAKANQLVPRSSNTTGWKRDPHQPGDRDWWRKRKWQEPRRMWCDIHKCCGHSTQKCNNKKKKEWIVKYDFNKKEETHPEKDVPTVQQN